MIILQKYTESFHLAATACELFIPRLHYVVHEIIVNGKHYNSNKSLTKSSSFVHAFWPTSLQVGEVQHLIKHQCQVSTLHLTVGRQ